MCGELMDCMCRGRSEGVREGKVEERDSTQLRTYTVCSNKKHNYTYGMAGLCSIHTNRTGATINMAPLNTQDMHLLY